MRIKVEHIGYPSGAPLQVMRCELGEALDSDDPEFLLAAMTIAEGDSYWVGGGASPLFKLSADDA